MGSNKSWKQPRAKRQSTREKEQEEEEEETSQKNIYIYIYKYINNKIIILLLLLIYLYIEAPLYVLVHLLFLLVSLCDEVVVVLFNFCLFHVCFIFDWKCQKITLEKTKFQIVKNVPNGSLFKMSQLSVYRSKLSKRVSVSKVRSTQRKSKT